ncbi:ATP-binding protein [Chloroflexi bacterium TSY]|nr:ATP-binding protein [Chloroflexi bacterium TSY]
MNHPTFFPLNDQFTINKKTEIGYTLRFIANEMMENILRHSDTDSQHPARFSLYLPRGALRFYITNSIKPEGTVNFQTRIQELLTKDPHELYIQQIESTMEEGNTASGMGYLTMLTDSHATLAWKFESLSQTPQLMVVTTMVEVPI